MSVFREILDGSLPAQCGVGELFSFRRLELGTDVIPIAGSHARELGCSSVLVVTDSRTRELGAEGLMAALRDNGMEVEEWVLEDHEDGSPPCADDGTVQAAVSRSETKDLLISFGAGTINDVVKMASHHHKIPFFAIPTAASMNGYTSAIAAILSGGVKRTIPTGQVSAIFGDLNILAHAPQEMTWAGFGDLVSKPYSNACWYLSSMLSDGVRTDTPAKLLDGPFHDLLTKASGIKVRDSEAIRALTETLLLSGCAMALAGSSSPASGGEHLISHYWDMVAHANHRPLRAFHGTQVGIATLVSGRLYEGILGAKVMFSSIEERYSTYPFNEEEMRMRVLSRHPDLPTDILEEVVEQSLLKYLQPAQHLQRLKDIEAYWEEIRDTLQDLLLPVDGIEQALLDAGAPTRSEEIGVDLETLSHTVLVARDIRSRYTILDFASDLGVLGSYTEMLRQGRTTGEPPA